MQVGCAWAAAATVVVMVTVGPEVTVLPSARRAAVAGAAAVLLGVQAVGVVVEAVAEKKKVSCYCRAACVAAGAHRLRELGQHRDRTAEKAHVQALGDSQVVSLSSRRTSTCAAHAAATHMAGGGRGGTPAALGTAM